MKLPGVRPSVCLSVVPSCGRCGGFTAVGPAGRRYRSIAALLALGSSCAAARRAAANAGKAAMTADVGSWTQICSSRGGEPCPVSPLQGQACVDAYV